MSFELTLHFITEHDRDAFVERVVPHLRGHLVEPPPDEDAEAQGYHRIAIAVTSPSAARDVCAQAFGFLAHMKNARIVFAWTGVDGERQFGEIASGEGRNADLMSVRVGAAAKAVLDAEKAAEEEAASRPNEPVDAASGDPPAA
jgi:hypothetical protein